MTGKLKVQSVRAASSADWEAAWRAYPHATYFHSPEWFGFWERYSDGAIRPAAELVTFSDGATAVLPLAKSAGNRLLSSPEATYGGWISVDPIGDGHARLLGGLLSRRGIVWRQNPFDPTAREPDVPWTRADYTHSIRYDRGLDEILRGLRKAQILRKAKQALAAGLRVERSTSRADLERYFEIYRRCRERWGDSASNDYDARLVETLDLESEHVDFWVARRGRDVLAAGPFFRSGRHHVVSWLTLADPEHLRAKPYELMYHHLIEHYGREGWRYFDFNPSGGHEGVVAFKESFGAERLPSNILKRPVRTHPLRRAVAAAATLKRKIGLGRAGTQGRGTER